jgi:hypothetical protein
MKRGSARLPKHMPPMNVARSTPREWAEEPMINCSICSHTTS